MSVESETKQTATCLSKAVLIADRPITLVRPETLEKFRNSPAAGCTTLMSIAQRRAAFYPALVSLPSEKESVNQANVSTFNQYIRNLTDLPLFTLSMADTKTLSHRHKDFNVLVDEIASLFQGVATADLGTIRQGLVSLARAAVSRTRVQQREFLFTESVLQCYGEAVEVNIYSSYVNMYADSAKGGTTTQAEYQVDRRRLSFRVDLWPEFAELVWGQQASSIHDWLTGNTTMPDPEFTKRLCIEPPD